MRRILFSFLLLCVMVQCGAMDVKQEGNSNELVNQDALNYLLDETFLDLLRARPDEIRYLQDLRMRDL